MCQTSAREGWCTRAHLVCSLFQDTASVAAAAGALTGAAHPASVPGGDAAIPVRVCPCSLLVSALLLKAQLLTVLPPALSSPTASHPHLLPAPVCFQICYLFEGRQMCNWHFGSEGQKRAEETKWRSVLPRGMGQGRLHRSGECLEVPWKEHSRGVPSR